MGELKSVMKLVLRTMDSHVHMHVRSNRNDVSGALHAPSTFTRSHYEKYDCRNHIMFHGDGIEI